MKSRREQFLLIAMIVFIVFSYLLFDRLFSISLPEFGLNLVAAFLCTVVTIALMMLLMQYQMRSEQEKEFKAILFEKKLDIYRSFLTEVFAIDDDNLIDREEVQRLENLLGEITLVASADLVQQCSRFLVQLKSYGVLYTRSMSPKQRQHFDEHLAKGENFLSLDDLLQAFRNDLHVVQGDVAQSLERVVGIQYDPFQMIRNPNNVD